MYGSGCSFLLKSGRDRDQPSGWSLSLFFGRLDEKKLYLAIIKLQ